MPAERATTASLSRWLMLLSVLVLTACSATPHTASARPPHASPAAASASASPAPATTSPPAPATPPAIAATHGPCPRTARLGGSSSSGFPEQQGVGVDATLWALFFGDEVVAGQEVKVVWRMTGSGSLSISATGPDAKILQPEWGPESHGSSNWDRPGEEWGTGWVFPSPGCWTINATRTNGSGYLVLRVGS
jgi:hypothetical protein